jgi:ABC-type multidrug transport system fused ATPase/permease subunit
MWQTIKRALQLLGKEAGWLVVAGGLAIAAAALGLQLPPLLSELWQSYSDAGEVLLPLLKVAAVVAGQFILKYASNLLMSANVEVAAARLREALFAAMMEEDVAFFDSVHSAQLVNLLSVDVKELRDTLRSLLTEGLSYVATAAGGVASLFASSSKLSAALTSVVPFGLLVAHAYAARLRKLSRASQEAQAQTASIAAEALANIRTVKCFTAEELERRRYHDALATSSAASLRISSEIGLFHGLMGLGLSALAGGVFLYGGHLVSAGEMAQPQLLAFIMQTQGLTRSLEGLSIQHTRLLQAKGSFDRINAVLDAANERRARYRARHCARWEGFRGDLKLSGVTFAYPTRPTAVILKDVSIDIPAGKVVALAGPSGSGKSTVAALLLGYYQLPELQGDHGSSPASALGNGASASAAAAKHVAAAAPGGAGGSSAGADHAHASADATASAFVAPPQASRASRGLVTVDARPLPYVDMQWYREHVAFVVRCVPAGTLAGTEGGSRVRWAKGCSGDAGTGGPCCWRFPGVFLPAAPAIGQRGLRLVLQTYQWYCTAAACDSTSVLQEPAGSLLLPDPALDCSLKTPQFSPPPFAPTLATASPAAAMPKLRRQRGRQTRGISSSAYPKGSTLPWGRGPAPCPAASASASPSRAPSCATRRSSSWTNTAVSGAGGGNGGETGVMTDRASASSASSGDRPSGGVMAGGAVASVLSAFVAFMSCADAFLSVLVPVLSCALALPSPWSLHRRRSGRGDGGGRAGRPGTEVQRANSRHYSASVRAAARLGAYAAENGVWATIVASACPHTSMPFDIDFSDSLTLVLLLSTSPVPVAPLPVTRSLSTIAASDVIYVMSSGSVVESGSHAELCARPSGIYASLVRRQQQLSSAGGPLQQAPAASSAAARRPGGLASRLPPAARQPPVDAEAGFEAVMAERVAGPSSKSSAAA